jgi:octaprenyl-diphosphate synthase
MWSDGVLRPAAVDNTTPTLSEIFEPIRDDLARVDAEFVRHVQSKVELIPRIGKYIQSSGGKRIRPAVLLMASRLCGYTGDRAVLYAAVVEFIHTATLVHDDIIDDAELRRGRLAVHSQWGNDITVLLGDYLYIKSMALALTHDELEIIRRKTAYLFSGCSRIGGMLAGRPAAEIEALGQYGFKLGIAFQLVDDLLDLTGTVQSLGKPVASDLREGKITLPVIALMNRGEPAVRALITDVVQTRTLTPERWEEVSALLAKHRTIDYAYDRAVQLANEAKAHLQAFPPSDERAALAALPDYVLLRDR